jgi:hypothetical protein
MSYTTKEGWEVKTKEEYANWLCLFYGAEESKGLAIAEAVELQKREL